MTDLITTTQLADPDAAYNMLVDAHRDLSETQSADLNARLVLLLANHVGDICVLEQAVALAKTEL
ncbi:uncharacterized protein DUF2783 [Breoghania corrubedonensis]|uniref:Uncharacterized protein DUF2783 n=1 Tax=Breoghania corrubedonensis TaxID=665038 RepID=A0A2T5VB07_9HYPH|nr:DUF2783 domain-containing protein [Breoghania corrubedonensis]PTW60931.1 uncharacterized protein DUF2783 [Breoghania corrubedonensis]